MVNVRNVTLNITVTQNKNQASQGEKKVRNSKKKKH